MPGHNDEDTTEVLFPFSGGRILTVCRVNRWNVCWFRLSNQGQSEYAIVTRNEGDEFRGEIEVILPLFLFLF
jgi:hypothetical protein